ncbi:hypothetical protein Bca101_101361 [Brassica carinata]
MKCSPHVHKSRPKASGGSINSERAFVHSCVHGYHGSWLDIIHPFNCGSLDQTTGKIRENDNTWLDDQPLLPGRI